jgi:hypothetical protein
VKVQIIFLIPACDFDVTEARGGHNQGGPSVRVADVHVRDVDTEEGGLQAPGSPDVIYPPENVVLKEVIACHAEASQLGHVLKGRLEVQAVSQA